MVLNTLGFPINFKVRFRSYSERPSRPHVGEVAVNIHSFRLGLTLPMQPFIRKLLSHMGVAPIQSHPNFFKFVISCRHFWISRGWGEPDFEDFCGVLQSMLTSRGMVVTKSWKVAYNPTRLDPFTNKKWDSKWVFVSGDWGQEVVVGNTRRFVPTIISYSGVVVCMLLIFEFHHRFFCCINVSVFFYFTANLWNTQTILPSAKIQILRDFVSGW